jgi:flagellar basal body-associated protein FliL
VGHFKILFSSILSYRKQNYILTFLLLSISGVLIFIVRDIVHNKNRSVNIDPFIKSMDEVASDKAEMDRGEEEESGAGSEGVPSPEFVVSLPRVIANLKSKNIKSHPMISVELYMELSNRESAVEVKARQTEVKHLIARILEESQFEELDTPQGKELLKKRLRLSVTHMLNSGRVRKLFFKSIQIRDGV